MKDEWEDRYQKWKAEKRKKEVAREAKKIDTKVEYVNEPAEIAKESKREEIASPGAVTFMKKGLWLVPVLILIYLFWANFVVTQNFISTYDIGVEGESHLTPTNRISEIVKGGTADYRELTGGLVYFDVEMPRGSEEINVRVRFKGDFPKGSKFSLGASDEEEWHYLYRQLYNPTLEEVSYLENNGEVYVINPGVELMSVEDLLEEEGIVIATDKDLRAQRGAVAGFSSEMHSIDFALRGGHEFYVYLDDELDLKVSKQDINWYEGEDELIITLLDLDGNLIAQETIKDDGAVTKDKRVAAVQMGEMKVTNLDEGVYKLEFSNFDGLIRRIQINSNKMVSEKLFLAENKIYGVDTSESEIYFYSTRVGQISLVTFHDAGLQRIDYYKNGSRRIFDLDVEDETVYFDVNEGSYKLVFPENDLTVSGGYFAFWEGGYFTPFKQQVVGISNDFEWLLDNVDYVVTDYKPATADGEWKVAETTFNVIEDGLVVKDNKLSMVFNTPHLGREGTTNNTIPIDWIKIRVEKPGAFA